MVNEHWTRKMFEKRLLWNITLESSENKIKFGGIDKNIITMRSPFGWLVSIIKSLISSIYHASTSHVNKVKKKKKRKTFIRKKPKEQKYNSRNSESLSLYSSSNFLASRPRSSLNVSIFSFFLHYDYFWSFILSPTNSKPLFLYLWTWFTFPLRES